MFTCQNCNKDYTSKPVTCSECHIFNVCTNKQCMYSIQHLRIHGYHTYLHIRNEKCIKCSSKCHICKIPICSLCNEQNNIPICGHFITCGSRNCNVNLRKFRCEECKSCIVCKDNCRVHCYNCFAILCKYKSYKCDEEVCEQFCCQNCYEIGCIRTNCDNEECPSEDYCNDHRLINYSQEEVKLIKKQTTELCEYKKYVLQLHIPHMLKDIMDIIYKYCDL
jgi:hypothetical protein